MSRIWQKRLLLFCVLALLTAQQLSAVHIYTHLGSTDTGECLDCDALNNFKATLPYVIPRFNEFFDAIDHVIHSNRQPVSRFDHVALIRAPPSTKVR